MLRLDKLKISARIGIACVIPMLAFTGFAVTNLLDKRATASATANVLTVIETAPSISNLIHEVQRERGASVTFVNSKGQQLGDVMRNQRSATDKAAAAWRRQLATVDRQALGSSFTKIFGEAETALNSLAATRGSMDSLTISGPDTVRYFTQLIAQLVSTADALGFVTKDPLTIRQANAFAALLKRKEMTGQERANGALGFSTGQFSPQLLQTLIRLGGQQDAQTTLFALNASPAQVEAVNATLKGPIADEMQRMRGVALASASDPAVAKTVSGVQWFETSTRYIDLLKVAEDKFVAEFLVMAETAYAEVRRSLWFVTIVTVAMLLFSGALAVVVALSITRPVARIVASMSTLAAGNTSIDIPDVSRGDEIGTMAQATLKFRDAAIEKARLEAATAERDRRAAAERAAAEAKIMNEFEAAVGGIVKAALAGDFSQRVSLEGKQGVIRNLAESMNSLCENVGQVLKEMGVMLGALAEGNLTRRIEAHYQGMFETLKDNANTTAVRLSETIGKIKAAAGEVANASAEISTSTTDLSQRTEEQASSLEQTSASMEQISATVKKNAESAQQANQSAASTRDVAARGGEVVAQAVEAMSRIEESSRKISDIISVIDEIARQTNLLALNAAVEAARAGDAGRGFAVVASEVRSLAQRSSQAAKDITDLINNSTSQVKDGVELVNRAGEQLQQIVESINGVAAIVSDIANASAEQASGIDQVNKALTQMDEVTQQNSALVEENAATARTLEQQSQAMDQQVGFFHLDGSAQRAEAATSMHRAPSMSVRKGEPPKRRAVPAVTRSSRATALKLDQDTSEL
jgi:methyl-accepting chemotaxis protein